MSVTPDSALLQAPPSAAAADRANAGSSALLSQLAQLTLPGGDGHYDELRQRGGDLRPSWQRFFEHLPADETPSSMDRRLQQVARQLRADGVTYNVYADGQSSVRPWSLELLPLIVDVADWARIERGVVQRARLLEAMLHDLYAEQRLLREALLPPALLFRHPGYLRPLHGVRPAGDRHLHLVAFDLARDPQGDWWVLSQRTQSPSGLGYVLHNRIIVSRQFPQALGALNVQHIASSYRRLLDSVEAPAAALAARLGDGATPRVALLTPGPYNETYFEHAYLARHLGLPLVEGGDLTVRADRLYLRTVAGLEPVHGLLRRLDDDFCDPLELRADSTLGVPGLLQALRAGNVVIANALGSAFLESPAVEGFLPAIAQRLIGEPLVLPSLPTWWCGEAAAWRAVRPSLQQRVIRAAFPRSRRSGASMADAASVDQWIARIESDPDAWLAQGHVLPSQAPLWCDHTLASRPAVLRVYAIAGAGGGAGGWQVLPGGMTRVAAQHPLSVSMQLGGSSLDTWVRTDGAVDSHSMLQPRLRVDDIVARQQPVSSRTAEHLFWLGRYTERCEHGVRLSSALLGLLDAHAGATTPVLAALGELAAGDGLIDHAVAAAATPQALDADLLRRLASGSGDPAQVNGLPYNLRALAQAASPLRDRMAPEQAALLRRISEEFDEHLSPMAAGTPGIADALAALDRVALQLAAVTGAQTDRMTRDHGWRLLTIGRFVERLIGLAGAMQAFLEHRATASAQGSETLLALFDSTITFRARYQRHDELLALTDMLVLDHTNPRSFAGILRRLRSELAKLPGTPQAAHGLRERLPARGAGITFDELRHSDDDALAQRLIALAQRLRGAGLALSDDIGERFFVHAGDALPLRRI